MKQNNNEIWLLLDDRKGNSSQVLGVAKFIKSQKIIHKEIFYNNFANLHNLFLKFNITHVKTSCKDQFKPPWPKLIIGCGRRSAPIGLWIKKQSNNYSKYIQIMWPGYPYKNIDLIFTPMHDKISKKNNIIKITTSPNIINKDLLDKSYLQWKNNFNHFTRPKITLLIGGDTKKHKLQAIHIKKLLNKIKLLIGEKGSLLVTTSRRTSYECYKNLESELKNLPIKSILWSPKDKTPNPYYGYLSHADIIVVTGDSISLCSEACATGKPVLIYAPKDITISKHKIFHDILIKNKIAMRINDFNLKKINKLKYSPVNESQNIAKIIIEKFLQ